MIVSQGTHDASFLLLLRAIDRHLVWAQDFAAVGEYEAAREELEDAYAISAEIDSTVAGRA